MIKIALTGLLALGGAAAFATSLASHSAHGETERGFVIHDIASAPEATKPVLQWYVENFGFVPPPKIWNGGRKGWLLSCL